MTRKTRLIILLFCVVCFFVAAPVLVLYSEGYRFDFENNKITKTGGIYVRTFPAADQITIDSNISEKPGLFANSIFVQSLLPKSHTVLIKKNGYYDYFKTLPVQEKQVTKLENVLLIKKVLAFSDVADKIDYFSLAPNNQNIITAKAATFNYFSANNLTQKQTFSIIQPGTVSGIKWSDDSTKALIDIKNAGNDFYYLFDTALTSQASLKKPTATRLSYLDKNSKLISFDPQDSKTIFYIKNNTLYSASGNNALPIISNIISFKISGANITWLSSKGALANSDFSGKLIAEISSKDFPADSKKTYEIFSISGNTFLKEDNSLFEFNQDTKIFESFAMPALADYKILTAPDAKNLIYYSGNKIYLYSLTDTVMGPAKKFTQIFSGSQINYCQWLNSDYIIFSSGDKIIISEIDYRGNINAITLPQTINLPAGKKVDIKNPEIFFDQGSQKVYILSGNTLLLSEKLTP